MSKVRSAPPEPYLKSIRGKCNDQLKESDEEEVESQYAESIPHLWRAQ